MSINKGHNSTQICEQEFVRTSFITSKGSFDFHRTDAFHFKSLLSNKQRGKSKNYYVYFAIRRKEKENRADVS